VCRLKVVCPSLGPDILFDTEIQCEPSKVGPWVVCIGGQFNFGSNSNFIRTRKKKAELMTLASAQTLHPSDISALKAFCAAHPGLWYGLGLSVCVECLPILLSNTHVKHTPEHTHEKHTQRKQQRVCKHIHRNERESTLHT
jgi:hypothetical protein